MTTRFAGKQSERTAVVAPGCLASRLNLGGLRWKRAASAGPSGVASWKLEGLGQGRGGKVMAFQEVACGEIGPLAA